MDANFLDDEVRTLPPLATGLGAGGTGRTTTNVTSVSGGQGGRLTGGAHHAHNRAERLRQHAATTRGARMERRREQLGQALGSPRRTALPQHLATQVAVNDRSVLDITSQGLVAKDVDLTHALQGGPAWLQTQLDPDAAGRTNLLATARMAKQTDDRLGVKRARNISAVRPGVLNNPVTIDLNAVKFDTVGQVCGDGVGASSVYKAASRSVASAHHRSTEGFPTDNQAAGRTAALSRGPSHVTLSIGAALYRDDQTVKLTTPAAQEAKAKVQRRVAEEQRRIHASQEPSLAQNLSKIRTYLELLDTYSLHHFLIWNGKTLTVTPEFQSFRRKHEPDWPFVQTIITLLEKTMHRYQVPLAVVDGGKVGGLAACRLETFTLEDCLECVENIDQVVALLSAQGVKDLSGNKKGRQHEAAVRIQSVGRMSVQRRKYKAWLQLRINAIVIQAQIRRCLARQRVQQLLEQQRATALALWERLSADLKTKWAQSKAPRCRVEVHVPSLGLDEQLQLSLRCFPAEQHLTVLGRMLRASDACVAHVVVVLPRDVPQEVKDYWRELMEMTGIRDPFSRITIIVPERARDFPHYLSLTTLLLNSPATLRRLRHITASHKCAYLVPAVVGWQEKQLSVATGLPLLAPPPAAAHYFTSISGAKTAFHAAGVNVAIGVHDIYDQEDLIIALTKLIASNLDIDEWLLKTDGDFEGMSGATLNVNRLRSVHDLRRERRDLRQLQTDDGADAWANRDVQMLARAKLLKDLRNHLPSAIVINCHRALPDWASFLRRFLRLGGVIEAEPPAANLLGRVAANLLIEPDGRVIINATSVVVVDERKLRVGVLHPQQLIPKAALAQAATAVGEELYRKGVLGFATVQFVCFRDAATNNKRVWAEELQLFFSAGAAASEYFTAMTSTSDPNLGILAQAEHERVRDSFVSSSLSASKPLEKTGPRQSNTNLACLALHPFHHPQLSSMQLMAFFKSCRLQGVSFDAARNTGTVFNLIDSLASSLVGAFILSESTDGAIRQTNALLDFLRKHVGTRTNAATALHRAAEQNTQPGTDWDGLDDFLALPDAVRRTANGLQLARSLRQRRCAQPEPPGPETR